METDRLVLIDGETFVGRRGERRLTEWTTVPPNFEALSLVILAHDLLGESAIAARLETTEDKFNVQCMTGELEIWDEIERWESIPRCGPFVRVSVEVLREELPFAEWTDAPARMVLSVVVLGRRCAGPAS